MLVVNKRRTRWIMALIAGAFSISVAGSVHQRDCRTAKPTIQQVTTPMEADKESAADVSWFAWLSGDRRSKQFHYLDLLELLLREGDDFSANSPRTYD